MRSPYIGSISTVECGWWRRYSTGLSGLLTAAKGDRSARRSAKDLFSNFGSRLIHHVIYERHRFRRSIEQRSNVDSELRADGSGLRRARAPRASRYLKCGTTCSMKVLICAGISSRGQQLSTTTYSAPAAM